MTWRSAEKPRVARIITGVDCDTIQARHEKFSSFIRHGLSSHISCGCEQTVENTLLFVLSFPSFRSFGSILCDPFEEDNFVVTKTPHVFANYRGTKASWHADALANLGHFTLRISTNTKSLNSLSRRFGLNFIIITQSHRARMLSLLSVRLVAAIHFYIAQLYDNSAATARPIGQAGHCPTILWLLILI